MSKLYFDLKRKRGSLNENPENYPNYLEFERKNLPVFGGSNQFSTTTKKSLNISQAIEFLNSGEQIVFTTDDMFFGTHVWKVLLIIPYKGCCGTDYLLLLEEPKIAKSPEMVPVYLQIDGSTIIHCG